MIKSFKTPIIRDVFKIKEREEEIKNTPATASKKLRGDNILLSANEHNSKYASSSKKSEQKDYKHKRNLNKLFSNLNLSSSHQNFFNVINSVSKPTDTQKNTVFFSQIKMSEFVDIGKVVSNKEYSNPNLKKVVHTPSLRMYTVQVDLKAKK